MPAVLNLLWFFAGHVSLAVLALAWSRHTGQGDEKDHPFYKAGYREGFANGREVESKVRRMLDEKCATAPEEAAS